MEQLTSADIEALTRLLEGYADRGTAQRCLAALSEKENGCLRILGPLPTGHWFDIYATRAEWCTHIGDTIQGYDTLIPAMETTPHDSLRLYSLTAPSEWFLVFTDPDTRECLGMLNKKTEIQN